MNSLSYLNISQKKINIMIENIVGRIGGRNIHILAFALWDATVI